MPASAKPSAPSSKFRLSIPLQVFFGPALIAALCLSVWFAKRYNRTEEQYSGLEQIVARLVRSSDQQAEEAFAAGDFREAAVLLEAVSHQPNPDPAILHLRARSLECLGRFAEASAAYAQLDELPSRRLVALRGRKFCQRMATERVVSDNLSPTVLYRLHDELMQRGDFETAQHIARKLLPDSAPLMASVAAVLRSHDADAVIEAAPEPGRVDITLRRWSDQVPELLRGLKIGTLDITQTGVQNADVFSGLDIIALNLSNNQMGQLTGLRSLSLRRLFLGDTGTTDVRSLAGMPLRELNLAYTRVSSLQALALCPLEKLNLTATAVQTIEPLRGLELRELDLTRTRISDIGVLSGMPLEKLVLDGTAVRDLNPLKGAKLKSLSVANTPIKDISAIAGMPIVELDLRGCELLTDLSPLASCPRLERVILPRHLRAPADFWNLPRLKFVDHERAAPSKFADNR